LEKEKHGDQYYSGVGNGLFGLVVWFVKLVLLERYQFMDTIGGQPVKNPY
jgi:hypothetical protein